MKQYMRVFNSGQYVVFVKRANAQKVLESGRVNCSDCYCSCADCDRCALKYGECSLYTSVEITTNKSPYKAITDSGFEVSDLISKYYKPAPKLELKDGDVIQVGDRIIIIQKITTGPLADSENPCYEIIWTEKGDKKGRYCTYSLSTVKCDLLDEFKEIKVINNIYN